MKKALFLLILALSSYYFISTFIASESASKIEQAMSAKRAKKKIKVAGLGIGSAEDPQNMRNWYSSRLLDPSTGKMPTNIRSNELAFAKTLPI